MSQSSEPIVHQDGMPDYYKFTAERTERNFWRVTFWFRMHDYALPFSAVDESWPRAWAKALQEAREFFLEEGAPVAE